jgi:hypothetical protein
MIELRVLRFLVMGRAFRGETFGPLRVRAEARPITAPPTDASGLGRSSAQRSPSQSSS